MKPVFVIPHEKERENVEEIVGEETSCVFITTPAQVPTDSSVGFVYDDHHGNMNPCCSSVGCID